VPAEPQPDRRAAVDWHRHEDTGLVWGPFDVSRLKPSGVARARLRFRAQFPDLIWNAAALEGNNFTLPEVRTLLDGVTVGGKKLADEQQILALSQAYSRLDELVGGGEFALSKAVSDEINGIVARHEAIEAGHFRGEGRVTGGGTVRLADGGQVPGTDPGLGGIVLVEQHQRLVVHLSKISDPRHRALIYFASATRRQFHFDGNKRTAGLMMAGELMSTGYDVVSIPYSRKLEYNIALDAMFTHDDATELLRFLSTCDVGD